jgi:uncharacterized protein YdcH (DUF465 family)
MVNWLKNHKLLILLALIVAFILQHNTVPPPMPLTQVGSRQQVGMAVPGESSSFDVGMSQDMIAAPDSGIVRPSYEKVSQSSDRVVVQNSNLSLLVEDVGQTSERVVQTAREMGGFMVSTSYNSPGDEAFATVTVRVPTERLDEALSQFRSLAVKVTSENLLGEDVTEQYEDLDQRIETLKATKAKFEEILARATQIDDIVRINQEIINLEQQIDFATGQKMALEDNARLTKVTVYLSTDELALPYTPDEAFRPGVIFKNAVRSLLSTIQDGAGLVIWLGVYSVVWVPILLLIIWQKKRNKSNDPSSPRTSRLN